LENIFTAMAKYFALSANIFAQEAKYIKFATFNFAPVANLI
jgi:hypothetical protein